MLSPAFDASVSDLGVALLSGATLLVHGEGALAEALATRGPTHADLPPAALAYLTPGPSLRVVVIGGEPCPPEVVRAWARTVRVISVYGPTEATVCASLVVCDPATWTRPLLGAPIAGLSFRVLDEARGEVPDGIAGELAIAGPGLALGYVDDPALTASRFATIRGERTYLTGDHVVRHADGGLEFLGRTDRQVKLAGRLVALEEVEAALARAPGVTRAAAIVEEGVSGRTIRAFVTPRSTDVEAVRRTAAAHLPPFMVPTWIEACDALPTLVSGKIDRAALATPDAARDDDVLAAVVRAVLGVATSSEDDDLDRLGATSLARLAIVAAAEARGLLVDAERAATAPTLRALRAAVALPEARAVAGLVDDARAALAAVCGGRTNLGAVDPRGAILVTGPTGHLGAALLEALAARTDRPLFALVRAPDAPRAKARLARALEAYGAPALAARITALAGDVATPRLGLDPGAYEALAARASTVVHAAADVRLAASYGQLFATNVRGTAQAVALAAEGLPKAFHFVGTLSVFTAQDPPAPRGAPADALPEEGVIRGGYAQSKRAAEALVRAAAEGLASVGIHRLGLVTTPRGARGRAADDHLARAIRGLARLGAVPRGLGALRFDVTPADLCAEALADLVLAPALPGLVTHHLANRAPATLADLVEALRRAGVPIDEVPREAFFARAAQDPSPDVAVAELAFARERHPGFDLFEATVTALDVDATEQALGRAIVPFPGSELLDGCVARALAEVAS